MDLEFITHQQKCVCVRVMKLKVNLSSPQTITIRGADFFGLLGPVCLSQSFSKLVVVVCF